jgi:hypothetical protein
LPRIPPSMISAIKDAFQTDANLSPERVIIYSPE